jgi:23S rRNA G2445 N2-methylase RlmL
MSIFTTSSKIIITCHKRLSPFLQKEVEELGYEIDHKFITGIELRGTVNDCIRLNLNLRCASQILYSLKEFTANSPEEVYKKLLAYPWESLLSVDGYFSVTSNAKHFTVNNDMFVNVKVKDAIVDRMRRELGKRSDTGSSYDKAVIHLYWNETDVEVFFDTSGKHWPSTATEKYLGKHLCWKHWQPPPFLPPSGIKNQPL